MLFSRSITFDDEDLGSSARAAHRDEGRPFDEARFIEKLKQRDEEAFESLIDLYSGDIYALLYRLTENPEDARDLTQDTFLNALRSINGFRGESGLRTWLFRIAINESRNRFRWWKRRKRQLTISLDTPIGERETTVSDTIADRSESPEEAALAREREAALRSALLEIPTAYREVIVLCDIEGLSYEETASALATRIGTVKSRISRGREMLRQKLRDF